MGKEIGTRIVSSSAVMPQTQVPVSVSPEGRVPPAVQGSPVGPIGPVTGFAYIPFAITNSTIKHVEGAFSTLAVSTLNVGDKIIATVTLYRLTDGTVAPS